MTAILGRCILEGSAMTAVLGRCGLEGSLPWQQCWAGADWKARCHSSAVQVRTGRLVTMTAVLGRCGPEGSVFTARGLGVCNFPLFPVSPDPEPIVTSAHSYSRAAAVSIRCCSAVQQSSCSQHTLLFGRAAEQLQLAYVAARPCSRAAAVSIRCCSAVQQSSCSQHTLLLGRAAEQLQSAYVAVRLCSSMQHSNNWKSSSAAVRVYVYRMLLFTCVIRINKHWLQ